MSDIQAIAVPDTSHYIGVKINGIVYVKLEDARKLREGWDAADKRIAELEAAVKMWQGENNKKQAACEQMGARIQTFEATLRATLAVTERRKSVTFNIITDAVRAVLEAKKDE